MGQAPVDPTSTAAWPRLTALAGGLEPDLRRWFADDPGRAERLTHRMADLHVDLSKNLVDDAVLGALVDLARAVGLEDRRDAMMRGEHINVTEDRAVLHTALRNLRGGAVMVDGEDVMPGVLATLARMRTFAELVRGGGKRGAGGVFTDVVNIGIGGKEIHQVPIGNGGTQRVQPAEIRHQLSFPNHCNVSSGITNGTKSRNAQPPSLPCRLIPPSAP